MDDGDHKQEVVFAEKRRLRDVITETGVSEFKVSIPPGPEAEKAEKAREELICLGLIKPDEEVILRFIDGNFVPFVRKRRSSG